MRSERVDGMRISEGDHIAIIDAIPYDPEMRHFARFRNSQLKSGPVSSHPFRLSCSGIVDRSLIISWSLSADSLDHSIPVLQS